MKRNHWLFCMFGIVILVFAIIICVIIFSHFNKDNSISTDIDTNIADSAPIQTEIATSQIEGASGITAEQINVLTVEQSQAIVDMAACFTAFVPEVDENGIAFSRNTILNYLSIYYSSFSKQPDDEAPVSYSYSQLDKAAQNLFGCSIPSASPNDNHTMSGWSSINGSYTPSPEFAGIGTASLVSVEYDSDIYTAQVDIANCLWQRSSVYRLTVQLLPNPDSPTEFTFQTISFTISPSKKIDKAEASSEKPTANDVSYSAANCIDGMMTTVWCENANGNGTLEWLRLYPSENTTFSAIGIVNGNVSSQENYYNNGRVKSILIQLPGGYSIRQEIPDDCFANNGAPYIVLLGSDIQATWVKIIIESVYEGRTYNDTCVSEIRLY